MTKQLTGNHTGLKVRLDLQHFSDDDAILPDGFDATPEAGTDTGEDYQADTEPQEDPQGDQLADESQDDPQEPQEGDDQPKFKIKYNHEEQEIGYDDAIPLIQKGMNYDKVQERVQELENDPRISFIDQLAQENGMSTDDFLENVRAQREEAQLNELIQQNIPEEYAREMLENQKFRKQFEEQQKQKEQEEKQQQDFVEFFDYYQDATGKPYDPKMGDVPQEVWDAAEGGTPLKYAFMEHHVKQLQNKIEALQQNKQNKTKAPGLGVTQHGGDDPGAEDPFMQGFNSI